MNTRKSKCRCLLRAEEGVGRGTGRIIREKGGGGMKECQVWRKEITGRGVQNGVWLWRRVAVGETIKTGEQGG